MLLLLVDCRRFGSNEFGYFDGNGCEITRENLFNIKREMLECRYLQSRSRSYGRR